MGGYGSGRWGYHCAKDTADESKRLSISHMKESLNKVSRGEASTIVCTQSWQNSRGSHSGDILYKVLVGDNDHPVVELLYSCNEEPLKYQFKTTTTEVKNIGGHRWWFLCWRCNRRIGVIYLPPGEKYFACRHCHKLTYQTQLDSNRCNSLYKRLGFYPADYNPLNRWGKKRLTS